MAAHTLAVIFLLLAVETTLFSILDLIRVHRWVAEDGPCPDQLGVHLGLVKLVGPFALLAAAFVASGLCCIFEIANGEEGSKDDEKIKEEITVFRITLNELRSPARRR